jgi:phosphoribosyl-ATP pyrophosphohydrolase/phosphoribosyl-AMP cyclohydrolase
VAATLQTGLAHFFSRSRQRLWKKGEESGHFLHVHEVWADCDADCLLYLVDPDGPSCHTGRESCFFARVSPDGSLAEDAREHGAPTLVRLWSELEARREQGADTSYTRALLDKGAAKVGEKLREEADELARAVAAESDERVVSEAGDLFYHLLVGLLLRKLTLRDVQAKLASRFGVSGIVEKASRNK